MRENPIRKYDSLLIKKFKKKTRLNPVKPNEARGHPKKSAAHFILKKKIQFYLKKK